MHKRPVNGLRPTAVLAGHDGCNDIDKLSQAGNFHPVRIAQQRDQQAAGQQGILEIVDIFQQGQRLAPAVVLRDALILLERMVPNIPLVKR